MKCTVLVDNRANPSRAELRSEHGLSLLIETGTNTILFDSGASDLFIQNSKKLGINLQQIDTFVLSHGHYDHGGGLAAFLKMNSRTKVYYGPGALETHVAKLFGFFSKDIGLNQDALVPFLARFVLVKDMKEIVPGVFALSHISLVHKAPKDMGIFYKRPDRHLEKDDFTHEMLLVVKEGKGIRVLTGCAHKGILNILSAAQEHFPDSTVEALIGGLHMTNPVTKRLSETEENIRLIGTTLMNNAKLKMLYTGHCTGPIAYATLQQVMGAKLHPLMVGKHFSA